MNNHKRLKEQAKFIIKAQELNFNIPRIWTNGHTNWDWSKEYKCFIKISLFTQPPQEFCFGDRYIHWENGNGLRGSTSYNWHGYSFGYDLKSAIEWIQKASFNKLGWLLWSGVASE